MTGLGFGVGLWQHKASGGGPNPPGPIPGPLDFGSGEMDQTSYSTSFDVAAPHVVLGMNFYYTGSPSFTITHNGEPLEGRVQLNANRGCLLFIGDNLTIETGALEITCTGGTFGPFYGRVNEMPFAPNMASLQWITENFTGNTKTFQHTGPNLGRVYGIVASAWWVNPPTTPPLDIKVTSRDFYGAGIGWTPGADGFNWTWDTGAREATHVGPVVNASRPSELDAQNAGPFRFRCDISDYTDPPVTTSVQYRDASGLNGANAPLQRFGNVLSGLWSGTDPYKRFELRMGNDVKISNIRVYNATVNAPAICGVIASADNLSYWYYSSATNMPCAAISLKVAPSSGTGPSNTVAPVLMGTIQVGATIGCNPGTWTGSEPITYTYQWRRNGVNISGATDHVYQIVAADATTNLSCVVTATNAIGAVSAVSNTQPVPAEVPVNTVPPLVIGGATVGLTLTSDYGEWTGSPEPDLFINWQESSNGVTGWTAISGQTSPNLTVTSAYMGKYLRTLVTAVNVGGNTNMASNTAGPVV